MEITQFLFCRTVWRWREHFIWSSLAPLWEYLPLFNHHILPHCLHLCVWWNVENQPEHLASLCLAPLFQRLSFSSNYCCQSVLEKSPCLFGDGCYLKVSFHGTPNELSSHYTIKVIPRGGKVSLTHLGGLCAKNQFPRMTGRDTPDTQFLHLPRPLGSFNMTPVPTGEISSQQAWEDTNLLKNIESTLGIVPFFFLQFFSHLQGCPFRFVGKIF